MNPDFVQITQDYKDHIEHYLENACFRYPAEPQQTLFSSYAVQPARRRQATAPNLCTGFLPDVRRNVETSGILCRSS